MANKQYTGIDGALYVNGAKVARVESWNLTGNVDSLETTNLGQYAKTYINGNQSYSGSATIFYYENASNQIEGAALLDDVLRTTQTPNAPATVLKLQLNNGGVAERIIEFTCLISSVDITAQAAQIIQANIQYNVTGPLTTVTVV
jgi:hypothetical protein